MEPTRESVLNLAANHAQDAKLCAQQAKTSYIKVRSLSLRYRRAEAAHRFCANVIKRAAKSLRA